MLPVLNAKLAVKAALLAAPVLLAVPGARLSPPQPDPVSVVTVAPGPVRYRVAGDFARDGRPVNAPQRDMRVTRTLVAMKYQVTAADYGRCVADGACPPRAAVVEAAADADRPVTGVSWYDASAYAAWLSRRTGRAWRLPTDIEWAHLAGSRMKDDVVEGDDAAQSFAARWLAKYEQESARPAAYGRAVRPAGSFGENERGVADIGGNVWEWTDTCFLRQGLDGNGEPTGARTTNCGVRVVEGEHRSYVTDFIRDARAGGCAVGIPPANLGFRLVRDDR